MQWHIYRYIETNAHIDTKVRWTPTQGSTDGLYTTTHTVTFSTMHTYRGQIDPPVLAHEVTNTKFEMKYPDRFLLTSICQEWQYDIATDS